MVYSDQNREKTEKERPRLKPDRVVQPPRSLRARDFSEEGDEDAPGGDGGKNSEGYR